MSFYKIVDSEGEGVKLLGDVPATASTGDILVWNFDYSKSTWLAAFGINFQSWSSGNENLVNFQVKTTQGKNNNLLTAYEGIDAANPLTSYRLENYNKFRTLHNNDLAIVEINTRLAKGAMGGSFPNNANVIIEYRKANPDGTIAEDNYLKLQQDSLHSNPIETNNFSIDFDGDFKVNKHSGDTKKVAVWDENGVLQKSTFDPGEPGGGTGTEMPEPLAGAVMFSRGNYGYETDFDAYWTRSTRLRYFEQDNYVVNNLRNCLLQFSSFDMDSQDAITPTDFIYSTTEINCATTGEFTGLNQALMTDSTTTQQTYRGEGNIVASITYKTENDRWDENRRAGIELLSINSEGMYNNLRLQVDSKYSPVIYANNFSISYLGDLSVTKYNDSITAQAYFDGNGTLLKSVNSPVRSSAEVRVTPTVGQSTHSFGISDFRVQEFSEEYTFLYDNIKYLKAFLIRPDGNGEYFYFSASSEIIQRRKVDVIFNEVFQEGDEVILRIDYVIPPYAGS